MAKKMKLNMDTRRQFLRKTGMMALASTSLGALGQPNTGEGVTFAAGPRPMVRYPGKRELILVHSRPPHLETPFSTFNDSVITPNDAFYVRYHLANFPTAINPETYRLSVKGKTTLSLSLADLKALPDRSEVVAVNQCSGNSRGYSSPRVFGAQLGNGAMGNAKWTGVSLKSVLELAGVSAKAKLVTFNGMDTPVMSSTPDFRKALDIEHAISPEPMLAWAMNGEDLPFLNGYPLKLIVPGYFGTYWVKHLSDIEIIDHEFSGHDAYFMNSGYRLPDNKCLCVAPGTTAEKTRPISTLPVRSFITSVESGGVLPAGREVVLKGIAFDKGTGIKSIEVSADGGGVWRTASLGENLGRHSFRQWSLPVTFSQKGDAVLMVRASSNGGDIQPMTSSWNPGGYRRWVVESTHVTVA